MHAVYRFYAENGDALYVGATDRPLQRIGEILGKYASDLVAPGRIEFTYHASRESAFGVEQAEIQRLKPKLNVRYLRDESDRACGGEVREAVLAAIADLGDATTSDVARRLPAVNRKSIATTMLRLRVEGLVDVVGQRPRDHQAGRPQFVVRLRSAA